MARLTNTPQQQLQFDLERRKSYSFRCVLLNADRSPLDLTNCKLRFVMKAREYDDDLYDTTNVIVNHEALILSPEFGEATFAFQAAELDVAPGAYNYAIVLWTKDGYSVVVVKGIVNLHANTDSASITRSYTTNSADAALELTLRGNDVVNIVTNTLTKSEARVEIIGTGRPDDASTLAATTIQKVANAQVGTLFISLDGAGIGAWAWRKRRTGWGLVEGFPIMWGDIQNRPSLFPPSSHKHPWSDLTGVPTAFPPGSHQHPWSDLTGVPTAFPPSAHQHLWADVTGKPATFAPTAHTHQWSEVDGKPTLFPPESHTHPWASVTGKPTTFAPSAHTHQWNEVEGKPASFPAAPHSHTWTSVTGKPTLFPAEPHAHQSTEITAVGTRSDQTFLRGDNTWSELPPSGLQLPIVTAAPAIIAGTQASNAFVELMPSAMRYKSGAYEAHVQPNGVSVSDNGGGLVQLALDTSVSMRLDVKQTHLYFDDGGEQWGKVHLPIPQGGEDLTFATTADVTAATAAIGGVLLGTGSPQGRVAAPVGSQYRDTAATTGAIIWVKASGTGTTGWVVQHGDTGWRQVTTGAMWVLASVVGYCRIKRSGDLVTLVGRISPAADQVGRARNTARNIINVPTGFNTANPYAPRGSAILNSISQVGGVIGNYGTTTNIDLYTLWTGNYLVNDVVSFEVTWRTNDPWPTVLPGSPV